MSSDGPNKRVESRPAANSTPLPSKQPQARDGMPSAMDATGLPANRIFADMILDWWDTHADHIFSERERKTD